MNLQHQIPKEEMYCVVIAKTPLFVTAKGIDVDQVRIKVEQMHGPYRIPTLLKKLDQLSRE
jgi:exodeoxyribonuclease-5/deoxyribonuclease V